MKIIVIKSSFKIERSLLIQYVIIHILAWPYALKQNYFKLSIVFLLGPMEISTMKLVIGMSIHTNAVCTQQKIAIRTFAETGIAMPCIRNK